MVVGGEGRMENILEENLVKKKYSEKYSFSNGEKGNEG